MLVGGMLLLMFLRSSRPSLRFTLGKYLLEKSPSPRQPSSCEKSGAGGG